MARSLTSGMLAGIAAPNVRPVFFVQAQFASETLYMWTGLGSISWNGQTWIGVGSLGAIAALPETATLQAQGVTLSLSAIPSDLLADVLSEIQHGLPASVWFGLLDGSGSVIADPYQTFSGRIDGGKINDDGKTAMATVTVETRMIDLNRVNVRRYTNEDQQIDSPGDVGFQYVPLTQFWQGVWGVPKQ